MTEPFKSLTTYWERLAEYRPPASELPGYQTFVHNPDGTSPHDTDGGGYTEQGLPTPPWFRSKPTGKPMYQGPGPSGTAPDEKSLSQGHPRTMGKPGEDSPPDDGPARTGPKRRPIEGGMPPNPPFPGSNREHEQKGLAKNYHKRYYMKNKGKIKQRMRKWHRKWDNRVVHKKDKLRRNTQPEKFFRRPGGGYTTNAERSKDYREQNKEACLRNVVEQYGLGIKVSSRYAEMLYEERRPESPVDQYFDQGSPIIRWPEPDPLTAPDDSQEVYDNPGSGKVIPYNRDFINNTDIKGPPYEEYQKNATLIAEILEGCSPNVHQKSQDMGVKLVRVDQKHNLWLFNVVGKTGTYRVRIKTLPQGNIKDPSRLDVLVSCSCPFWRWQGPEYHAQQNGYLYGKPVGTASEPVIRDPEGQHWACKHMVACLQKVLEFKKVPGKKKVAGLQYLADKIASSVLRVVSEEDILVASLVERYRESGRYK